MRKWSAIYFSVALLIALFAATIPGLTAQNLFEKRQASLQFGQSPTINAFLGSEEKQPLKDVLEADAVSFLRIAVQERNSYPAINSSFFNTTLLSFKERYTVSGNSNNIVTSYLACIYPSHNFW